MHLNSKSNEVKNKIRPNFVCSVSTDYERRIALMYKQNPDQVGLRFNYPSTIVRPEEHVPITHNITNSILPTFKLTNQSFIPAMPIFKVPQPPEMRKISNATSAISLITPTEAKKKEKVQPKPVKVKLENKNINESIHFFTGTAEKIIKWNAMQKEYFCLYELIASIVSIQPGTERLQQVMLLRDKKGPVIQVVHYINDHINIEDFYVGQMLRCVGRMIGRNMMHGLSIRAANEEEIATLQRVCHLCDDAVTKSLRS